MRWVAAACTAVLLGLAAVIGWSLVLVVQSETAPACPAFPAPPKDCELRLCVKGGFFLEMGPSK